MSVKIDSELVLEMFSRIKMLENKMEYLEDKISLNKIEALDNKKDVNKSVTRKKAREYVLNKLEAENPKMFDFNVAKRKNGSGIGFSFKDKIYKNTSYPMYAKFFFSNMTGNNDGFSWFTVSKNDIDEIIKSSAESENRQEDIYNMSDIIFFSLDEETKEELLIIIPGINVNLLMNYKHYDSKDRYHFYFKKLEDGRVIEFRDKDIDVTKCYNRYDLLTEAHITDRGKILIEPLK